MMGLGVMPLVVRIGFGEGEEGGRVRRGEGEKGG